MASLGSCELPDSVLNQIVEETFRDLAKLSPIDGDEQSQSMQQLPGPGAEDDVVTYEQYEKLVYENNDIIKWLAIDLHRVC
mmetsp:Transcript_23737/g.18134  ORF Transcript_23737/g.18134 Transcript_23737/m.18134 type:complete len:81 (+) Transcript_23737:406-648(+)|eukprot:CAMPEP_0202970268 /NCGR_PEP_ID=MMETSP1396-20130829/16249_1 /ASSEMBLY_ACC=CAM_ASM_000872 /TAXON_ID= /ORGANISM="Pseudokeronopsis sp., Strain Brazil" /LENGTH=80 /DNA_ID=CAMNT_0049698667 /DNA_START=341 /DNA_END=583 /DNA_ORIENTATION=-